MQKKSIISLAFLSIFSLTFASTSMAAAPINEPKIKACVTQAIHPVMQEFDIPGVAVAVSLEGKNYFYNYGVASKETQQLITQATLFEIGSLSKTFTATLAAYAQINGQLSLTENVSAYLPNLRGSAFDNISLLNLATHTSGDLPLQVPQDISTRNELMNYYQHWQPHFAAGTHRNYSNLSVGLLGVITAKRLNKSFTQAMEENLFPKLGLKHSYLQVPQNQMPFYAQGYDKTGMPVRLTQALLAEEAYGVKSNTKDLIRFVNANMGLLSLNKKLQQAVDATHIGYYTAGAMTQALIWEEYASDANLEKLLAGNSPEMVFESTPVTKIDSPVPAGANLLINKTGSTNGFAAYTVFNPEKKMGVVILANKNYPSVARVKAAYQIMMQLGEP